MRRIVDYPRRGRAGFRRFIPSWRLVLGLAAAVVLLGVIGFSVVYASVSVPDPNKLVTAQASVVYWADGKSELGRFSDVNRQSVPLSQVPEHTQKAVLAAEDRTFYSNHGVSPKGIARSVWVKLTGGSTQGGSTITQQYVKNYFLTQDRTYTRKAKEFVIALKVEQKDTKDKILENYLNTIYFGRGAYGIETASQAYFGHPAAKLTVSEGAVLAAIIRSPGLYDPVTEKARCKARFDYVLDGMVSQGWLTPAERAKQKFPKVAPRKTSNAKGGTTGYLLEVVRGEVKAKAGLTDSDIDRGGLKIVSTFDRKSQAAAVAAVDKEMPKDGAKGTRVGLAAVKPGDGAVLAMYGGPDSVKEPLNAATQSIMQAGSTFKPFALTAALESGISLRSRYDGHSPQTFPGGYEVSNFGGESFGRIDLLRATEESVNTVFVGLNIDVGPAKTVDAAVAAGLPKDTKGLEPNAANVLGTSSPHVIDMADAYATFAAQGKHAPPYTVRTVTLDSGDVVYKAKPAAKRVFSADSMADLTYAMQGVVKSGSGAYAGSNLGRAAAGKTGTSQNNKSAWFDGFTPQLAAAVGIYRQDAKGNPASLKGLGGRSEVTGGSFPVRIWTAFMKGALEGTKVLPFPDPVYGGKSNVPTATPKPTTSTTSPTTTPTTSPPTTPPTSSSTSSTTSSDPCLTLPAPLPASCSSSTTSPPPSTPSKKPSGTAGTGAADRPNGQ